VKTITGFNPNIYIIALAGSGSGKDYIRKVNQYILDMSGQGELVGESIASGEGIEDEIHAYKKKLYQTDEIQTLFEAIAHGKDIHYLNIAAFLLRAYTSSVLYKRTKADSQKKSAICRSPGLVLFGTSIPSVCLDVLTPKMITEGLVGRCLMLANEERQPYNKNCRDHSAVPQELIDIARWWADFIPPDEKTGKVGNLSNENPSQIIIPMTPDAKGTLDHLAVIADTEYNRIQDEKERALWNRVHEQACKLATLYACSVNHEQPVIDEEAACWASDFMHWTIKAMIKLINEHVSDSPFGKLLLRTVRIIRRHGGIISKNELSRTLHIKPREQDKLIQKLMCDETVETCLIETGGRPRVCFKLVQ
jgi:hypothetical protein